MNKRNRSQTNRSFLDNILRSNDEHAVKKLFQEYFDLHAKKTNGTNFVLFSKRFYNELEMKQQLFFIICINRSMRNYHCIQTEMRNKLHLCLFGICLMTSEMKNEKRHLYFNGRVPSIETCNH